jgi:phosphate transport system protein
VEESIPILMKTEIAKHTLSSFNEALENLRDQVLAMGDLVVSNVRNAERGLFERKTSFCATAIVDDAQIDQLEMEVDRAGVSILFHYQPVASDLRNIISAMKVSSSGSATTPLRLRGARGN